MYRDEDIVDIKLNVSKIIDKSYNEYKTVYEPTLDEMSKVYKSIKDYIIRNKKIVYGGFAQNILLLNKDKDDSFYKIINGAFYNWPDIADIEFYSSKPIQDVVDLCEELYKLGFKNIEAKEGIHNGTFKIFINFINYCDISYIPEYINYNIPTINVSQGGNIICVHLHFMLCDTYRILTDPMTSYWRLDKAIYRFNKLLKYYPIKYNSNDKLTFESNNNMKFIRKKIIHNSKLIVVGFYAFDYYSNKLSKSDKEYDYYEVISTDIINDSSKIEKILRKKYDNGIKVKQFTQFLELIDKRIEFYHNDKLLIKVYGNYNRCIVHRYSKHKKTYFGTYNLVYMYFLFNYFYHVVNKNKSESSRCNILLLKLSEMRNKYLTDRNITVIDKSPFEDFTMQCFGIPVDLIRKSRLEYKKNRSKKFNYKPSGNKITIPKINFDNLSGNIILNEKNYFYNSNL